jgi:hypothetical protein
LDPGFRPAKADDIFENSRFRSRLYFRRIRAIFSRSDAGLSEKIEPDVRWRSFGLRDFDFCSVVAVARHDLSAILDQAIFSAKFIQGLKRVVENVIVLRKRLRNLMRNSQRGDLIRI